MDYAAPHPPAHLAAPTAGSRVRDFARRWTAARCVSRAAALAYFAIFSLAPILVIVVAVGTMVVEAQALRASLLAQVYRMVGVDGVRLVTAMLDGASEHPRGWYALIAGGILIVSATTAFSELKDALDAILGGTASGKRSLLSVLCSRVMAFVLVLALALVLMLAMVANAFIRAATSATAEAFGWERIPGLTLASEGVSIGGAFLLFAAIYWLLPARRMGVRAILGAAALTTLLVTAGRMAIGVYLSHSTVSLAFGAAGSMAMVLLWTYYAALSFLAGTVVAAIVNDPAHQPVRPQEADPR
ncbi:MAG: YihY/virulence factor BrkB family protein [Burkholderiales bacterium]